VADTEYSLKDRVAMAQDRDGVTEGTVGTVIQVSGLTWIRYRVRFDSGVERNLIDGRYLRPAPAAHRR
jgi:hypothetical protein